MKLYLLNETFEYPNQASSIEEMFNLINEKVADTEQHFSHLVIDGEQVYTEHDAYLFEKIDQVQEVEVKVKTMQQLIDEIFEECEGYINRALPEVKVLTDEFYQGQQPWDKFTQFIEGLQWINQMLMSIDSAPNKPQNWDQFLQLTTRLQDELKNLEEAVENKDDVLIADIISYEIIPIYEDIHREMTTRIDNEGTRVDAN